jgi:hypothetical protein
MIKEREREWHIRTKYPTIHIITNGDGGDNTRGGGHARSRPDDERLSAEG